MRTNTHEKKGTFLWSRWDSNPRTTQPLFWGPRLYRLSYDSVGTTTDCFLFGTCFYFNNHIDDTGENRLGTISLLDLQLIVECVDRLDGHCLHNHDRKSHLKTLARSVHGLWLSSTTRRNRHRTCFRWLARTCHWSPHTSNV